MKFDFHRKDPRSAVQVLLSESQSLILAAISRQEHVSETHAARCLLIAAIEEYAKDHPEIQQPNSPTSSVQDEANKKDNL